ncbi:MAG: ABC transporter ATP-binding protein [Negativicutes bacterium]|jgi:subfamily B ATP-binding cassette protein MsbA
MFEFYFQKFIKPYWIIVSFAIISFFLATYATLCMPYLVRYFLDVTLKTKIADSSHYALFEVVRDLVLLYTLKGVCFMTYQMLLGRAGTKFVVRLRESMFSRVMNLRLDYFDKNKRGEVLSLFTNDLLAIQQALTVGMIDFMLESLGLIALVGVMLWMSWKLTIITLVVLPIIALATNMFKNKLSHYGGKILEVQSDVTELLYTYVSCVKIIRSYVREHYELKRFQQAQAKALVVFMKMQKYRALLLSLSEVLAMLGIVAILIFGGSLIINGELTVGYMFAFLVYLINLPVPVKKIVDAFTALRLGLVAWERISFLNQQPLDVVSGTADVVFAGGRVEFCDVSYGYNSEKILKDISFTVEPGDFFAVVGPSGAGKSSLAALILRFADTDSGEVLFDGKNIASYKRDAYRQNIGYIQQEAFLFNQTIAENIRYGNFEASDEEVIASAVLANADEFIQRLPQKYQTNVGTYGSKLSGGQRQRIALARAMLKKPKLVVLDEPTAALDSLSEQQVFYAIKNACKGITTILITHNYQLLCDDDKIICLDKGNIVEVGTHKELLQKKGYYYYLYNMRKIAEKCEE